MNKTIWGLIEQKARPTSESLEITLIDVDWIEDTEWYLATFEGFVAKQPKYGKYTVTFVYRITADGNVSHACTETVQPTDTLHTEDDHWDEVIAVVEGMRTPEVQ